MTGLLKIRPGAFFKNLAAAASLATAIFAAVTVAKQGISQYLAGTSHFSENELEAARAIEFDTGNPDAHKARGILLMREEKYEEAADCFSTAAALRPADYSLWLRLGDARYKLNEFDEAVVAYDRAISLAPNYAITRWYKGMLFLKTNRPDKAFIYLSQAAAIDPSYLPEALRFAHLAYPGDPEAIEKAVRPESIDARKTTAFYLIEHKMMTESVDAFLLGDELGKPEKDEFVGRFIEAKDFQRAFSIWASGNKVANDANNLLLNGDFETEIDPDERNFGWVINDEAQNTVFNVDRSDVFSNSVALQVEFNGKSEPVSSGLSQLLPVKPARQYQLTFAARSEEIVSGGLPVIAVTDAVSGAVIQRSETLSSGAWHKYAVSFRAGPETTAIIISLQRMNCASSPCPIFGRLWLDNFVLNFS